MRRQPLGCVSSIVRRSDDPRASRIRFEIYRDYEGRYRWRLWGQHEDIIADSARSFRSRESARKEAFRVKGEAVQAEVDTKRP